MSCTMKNCKTTLSAELELANGQKNCLHFVKWAELTLMLLQSQGLYVPNRQAVVVVVEKCVFCKMCYH